MIDGVSSTPFSATTMPPIKEPERSYRKEVIDMSRMQFAMKREAVEQGVMDWHKDKGQLMKKTETPAAPAIEKKPEVKIPEAKVEKIAEKIPEKKSEPVKPAAPASVVNKVVEKREAVLAPAPAKTFDRPKYVRREDTRPPPPSVMPAPDDLSDDDFIPLKELKVKTEPLAIPNNAAANHLKNMEKKAMNPKNLSDLRAVLQSFTKNKTNDKVPAKEAGEKKEVKKEEYLAPEDKKGGPREIPEDKLRQMLQVNSQDNK
jgi:hypothetical protein